MQLMPATAAHFHVNDPFNPAQNIRGGTQTLVEDLMRYQGNLGPALAAYNAGPKAVDKNRIRPETAGYVTKVLDTFKQLGGTVPPDTKPIPATLPDKTKDKGNLPYAATGVHEDDFKRLMAYVDADPDVKRAEALSEEQIAANEALKIQHKVYRKEFARLMGEIDAEYDNLPPRPKYQQMPKEELEPIRNPLTALQQFMPMLALLGGALNKNYALAGMEAATAAMNAQKAGDYAKRDQAHELWLDNTKTAVENNAIMYNQYREALEDKKLSIEGKKAKWEAIAAMYKDDVTMAGLPSQDLAAMEKSLQVKYKVVEGLSKVLAATAAANTKMKPFKSDSGVMFNYVNGNYVAAGGQTWNGQDLPEGTLWNKETFGGITPATAAGRGGVGLADRQGFEAEYAVNHNGEKPPQSTVDQWSAAKKAALSALTNIEKQLGSLEPYTATADFEAKRVIDRLSSISPTQFRAWNSWVRGARRDYMGDPAVVKFDEALFSLKAEYGRIMSGAVGSVAQLMQHNTEQVDQVISGNMSYEQISQVVPSMQQSMHQRLENLQEERDKTQQGVADTTARLAGSTAEAATSPAPAAAAPPAASAASGWRPLTGQEKAILKGQNALKYNKDGHMIVLWGGQWVDGETGKPL
jgi:hypothetical protein